MGDVCRERWESQGVKKGAHGVTSTSLPAMKGSRMQSKGNLVLS